MQRKITEIFSNVRGAVADMPEKPYLCPSVRFVGGRVAQLMRRATLFLY